MQPLEIQRYAFNFAREPLRRPFHFKGGFFTEKWILVTSVESAQGTRVTGIGGTAVLWSDPAVFFAHSEAGGNLLMAAMAERAVALLQGQSFATPFDALEAVYDEVHRFGIRITGHENLSRTFTLNALVSLDLALWKLYASENRIENFDDLLPEAYRRVFSHHHDTLVHVPLIPYNMPVEEIVHLAETGHFVLKIKIGQAGDTEEMLAKDTARLREIHQALHGKKTPHTEHGKLLYYLDANGRYRDKQSLFDLLDQADKIGMLEQILLLEEPFPAHLTLDVADIPVRVVADETLHSLADVRERIDLGYTAMAVKPAGKTLSMTLKMAAYAAQHEIPCFVADSACVPLLLDWNLNIAARLPRFPGLATGLIESNGAQQYKHWGQFLERHPCSGKRWLEPSGGFFSLDAEFYRCDGGIFFPPGQYADLVMF
ncbi:L-alanine-DL-glutamate epimerase [candidate division KSB3 bacterium]|uniref:L-alanine-DL-glutamate epimerase n=1 Tax=candidate division KSB3 bacterium TaxID=2044937 RepID=A0A9D5JYP1_9BACT|nr:L-alanine-DL-glutamate epimerase [candidate division KSB3 bacterium]MBD3326659.1 L-alanine-DL-glutamate epimerase [candidate division KSB3 bacterium]